MAPDNTRKGILVAADLHKSNPADLAWLLLVVIGADQRCNSILFSVIHFSVNTSAGLLAHIAEEGVNDKKIDDRKKEKTVGDNRPQLVAHFQVVDYGSPGGEETAEPPEDTPLGGLFSGGCERLDG